MNDRSEPDSLTELNPETAIFAHCLPSLLTSTHPSVRTEPSPAKEKEKEKEQSNKRPRQEAGNRLQNPTQTGTRGNDRQQTSLSNDLKLLARLLTQHEDQLAALRMDKAFVLFARQDTYSIIPAMYAISVEWNQKREENPEVVQSPLRTLLLACLIRELLQRIQKMVATSEGMDKLKAANWVSAGGASGTS